MRRAICVVAVLGLFAAAAFGEEPAKPTWWDAVRAVHAKFKGEAGTVGQFGDSITFSKAFFSALYWGQYTGAPDLAAMRKALPRACADWKGPAHANYSGWQIQNLEKVIDNVLKTDNPEVALLMIGTNDVNGSPDPAKKNFGPRLKALIEKCHANGTVVVLHTIPPKRGKQAAVAAYNKVIKEVADELKVPLADFYGEIIKRRPTDWDGTLIGKDGVHPSFVDPYKKDFTEAGLASSGYTLRNWLAAVWWYYVQDAFKGTVPASITPTPAPPTQPAE
jgi:hypothetical protein